MGKVTDLEWRENAENTQEGKRPHEFARDQATDCKRGCRHANDDAEHDPVIRRGTKEHGQSQNCRREQRQEACQKARFRAESCRVVKWVGWLSKRRDTETPLDLSIAKARDA